MGDGPVNPIHHIELWTDDLAAVETGWQWLLLTLGWAAGDRWTGGVSWRHAAGPYLVLEQSSAVRPGGHDRLRAGLNHLAVACSSVGQLDALRADAASHGWSELFADSYPQAGGTSHTALFLENAQGFEVEIVAPMPREPNSLPARDRGKTGSGLRFTDTAVPRGCDDDGGSVLTSIRRPARQLLQLVAAQAQPLAVLDGGGYAGRVGNDVVDLADR